MHTYIHTNVFLYTLHYIIVPMLVWLLISKYISLHADLVEKAYWQIALTDSDEKLERALGRLLAPVLLKASSKDSAVRDKVLYVLWKSKWYLHTSVF